MILLAADLGASHPIALLRWPDGRVRAVSIDVAEAIDPDPDRLTAILTAVRTEAVRVAGALPPTVLAHPDTWDRDLLLAAARSAGLPEPTLVPRPVAAATWFAVTVRPAADSPVVVVDCGADVAGIAVVRGGTVLARGHAATPEALPARLDETLGSAAVAPPEVAGLLLVGDPTRVPAVAAMLASHLPVPPTVPPQPPATVAEGALYLVPPARVPAQPPVRRRWPVVVTACLAALLLVLVGADVVVAVGRPAVAARPTLDRSAVLDAARTAARATLSYDYRTYDADVAKATAWCTGTYAGQYRKTMRDLRPQAMRSKAVVTASVSAAGVVKSDGDEVQVLLFVDQTLENTNLTSEKVDEDRVSMVMRKVDGTWRVAKVEAI